jgi:CDP-diacylglycerol--glycerol-3-phosphate 3-phosphatidyltransferase
MFKNKDISEYYSDLVRAVSDVSYELHNMGDTFQLRVGSGVPDPVEQSKAFKKHATKSIRAFMRKWASVQQTPRDATYDTTLYPLLQMGPLGIRQDERVTLSVLDHVLHTEEKDGMAKVFITSGYFNFENRYSQSIIHTKAADVGLIAASPEVFSG